MSYEQKAKDLLDEKFYGHSAAHFKRLHLIKTISALMRKANQPKV